MTKELKPCPFCGGSVTYDERHPVVKYISCDKCNVEMFVSIDEDSTKILIERWNQRRVILRGELVELLQG